MTKVQPWKSTMLTHRRSSAKASSLPTILMTPISTKKKRRIVRQMAENLMHALQYNSYGGGAVALKEHMPYALFSFKDR
ncbi:hypothetical protein E1A91_D08G094900v1 [Gossypium mustelinum]|uniref:Uncharacterized protein n=1 Tax=Gossypium mustelinum TaxID=34275 RepID=A0A5D2TV80_GOSMU|nr:hypothetical protein E1A91_D08G094900v1 [Gossypium mustelinum]